MIFKIKRGIMRDLMEIRNLSVSFDCRGKEVKALENLTLDLSHNEVLAVLGESGCGKSVLCKAIMGLLAKNACIKSGSILFGEAELLEMNEKQLNTIRGKRIAMIFQDPIMSLDPSMPVGKQVAEAVRLHTPLSLKEAKQRAIELMQLCGIENADQKYGQYPHQFSGGLAQRAVIAMALAGDPEVLIADEPTTSLDAKNQLLILELLKELQQKRGISVILITHDISVVCSIAQRVCIISQGRVVEMGTVQQILDSPVHTYTKNLVTSATSCGIINAEKYDTDRAG